MMYRIFIEIKGMGAPATACGMWACWRGGAGQHHKRPPLQAPLTGPVPRDLTPTVKAMGVRLAEEIIAI